MCIKAAQSPVRAHMHLTPQCKATKTFIYFTARRHPVRIEDWGDIVSLYWLSNQAVSVRVEIGRSAAEVEAQLSTFLEDACGDSVSSSAKPKLGEGHPETGHPHTPPRVQTGSSQPVRNIPRHMPTSVRGQTETHHRRVSPTGKLHHIMDNTAQPSGLPTNKRADHHRQTGYPLEKYRFSERC
jgi:hypothetical protein